MSPDDDATLCLFCEKENGSNEHAWPDWIRRFLLEDHPALLSHVQRPGSPTEVHATTGNDFEVKTTAVCHTCNTGWMRKLEDRTSPFLKKMILGESISLTVDQQRTLTRWCAKTAVTLEAALDFDYQTTRPYARRIALGMPLPGVFAITAHYEGMRLLEHFRFRFTHMVDATQYNVSWLTILIGKVLMQVVTDTSERPQPTLTEDALQVFVPLLAGQPRKIDWPARGTVGDVGVGDLIRGPNPEMRNAPRTAE